MTGWAMGGAAGQERHRARASGDYDEPDRPDAFEVSGAGCGGPVLAGDPWAVAVRLPYADAPASEVPF